PQLPAGDSIVHADMRLMVSRSEGRIWRDTENLKSKRRGKSQMSATRKNLNIAPRSARSCLPLLRRNHVARQMPSATHGIASFWLRWSAETRLLGPVALLPLAISLALKSET